MKFGIFDWLEHRSSHLHDIFEDRLHMLEAAENLGFYAYHVAEHQGTPLSLDSSPAIFLTAASQRTSHLRLGALVFCLPWYDPLRLYNEICMLDQISKGRLEVGIGRGVSPIEAGYYGIESQDIAREKFGEALDVVIRAFNSDTLNFTGKHYNYSGVELWNKPYQKPYPPLWYPTSNIESIPYVASQGFSTSHNFATNEAARDHINLYWEEFEKHKEEPNRLNGHVKKPLVSNTRHIYVAETDMKAKDEAREAFELWSKHISHLSGRFRNRPTDSLAIDTRMLNGTALVGSPASVRRQIEEMCATTKINYFLGVFNFGDLPIDKVLKSMELFSTEVMPGFTAETSMGASVGQ